MMTLAMAEEAPALAALHTAVAEDLTRRYGKGHWSSPVSEKAVLLGMRTSKVFVAHDASGAVIATLRLATKKPWAIDKSYFTECRTPCYLTSMAVAPELQHQGIGRLCVEEAKRIGREWPADAIRLDAYDAEAGAGGFYSKCGFREVGRVTYRNTPLIYFEMLLLRI
jgi:ribosomal protein S18 acetylase RimI-like enzyme